MHGLTAPASALPGLQDKAEFLTAFKIKSLPLSYNTDLTIIFPTSLHLHKHSLSISTKTLDFHTLPCSPILAFSTVDTKPSSMEKQHCSDNKGTSVGEAEDQGAGAHRVMLDPTGRPVNPSCTVQLDQPMPKVRSI